MDVAILRVRSTKNRIIMHYGREQTDMITSSNNAKVKQVVQWQTKAKERRKDYVFLAEGVRMCEEAPVKSVREVYLTEELEQKLRQNAQNGDTAFWDKLQQTGYETVSPEVFAKMADTQTPQGILTVLEQPSYDLTQLLEQPEPLFLILENLQDPGNLGTMIRTGEGAGITGVIMNSQTVDIFNPKTIRATMGSIFRVPFVYVPELSPVLTQMHEKGIHTYAAHLKGKEYYDSFSFREPTAFLIGNEGNGLTKEISDQSGQYLKIPMEGKVESLNASIAAALLMYEAHRQRKL